MTGEGQKKNFTLLIIFMLAATTLMAYWPVQNHEFIDYDDQLYVTKNYGIQNGLSLHAVSYAFTDISTSNWHPVTMLSHLLDWTIYGANAGGHHWTSLIIHVCNCVLLFFLLNVMTGAAGRSAFAAALFALHPINVESVAWIAERKNVLSTFFWLAAMLFYVRYVRSPGWKSYLPVFASLALGLMSKPMLVTAPFVLLLLDYWPLQRATLGAAFHSGVTTPMAVEKRSFSFLVCEKIPLLLLSAFSVFMTIYAAGPAQSISDLERVPFAARLGNMTTAYLLYLKKMIWPMDLHIFYPLTQYPAWQIIASLLILASITVFVLFYYRRLPFLVVGWLWYLGVLVPVIGLVQVGEQSMADRYAYVPFIGLFLMISWGAHAAAGSTAVRKALPVAAAFIIILFAAATFRQVPTWQDTSSLFNDALKKDTDNYLAHQTLGKEADKKCDFGQALSHYKRAIELKPGTARIYIDAGYTFIKMGNRTEAYKCFETALKLDAFSSDAHYNLGQFHLEENRLEESISFFSKAIELKPDFLDAYNNLGIAYVKKGNFDEGIDNFKKVLRISPLHNEARKNLEIALALKKKNN